MEALFFGVREVIIERKRNIPMKNELTFMAHCNIISFYQIVIIDQLIIKYGDYNEKVYLYHVRLYP